VLALENVDVLVVGAGVSGLACARELEASGLHPVVLEARPEVGGRVRTARLRDGSFAELGAQVVHGSRSATWEVLRAGGLDAQPLPESEELQLAIGGEHVSVSAFETFPLAPWQLADRLRGAAVGDVPLTTALGVVGLTGPLAQVAGEWATQTWAGDPHDLSAAGLTMTPGAGRDVGDSWTLTAGYAEVPRWLARGLDVRLRCPVARLRWRPGGVSADTPAGTFEAPVAVVTVPPPVVANGLLVFDPPLPDRIFGGFAEARLGDAIVVAVELSIPAERSLHVLAADGRGGLWQSTAGSSLVLGVAKGRSAEVVRAAVADPMELDALMVALLPWYRGHRVDRTHVADWGRSPWSQGGYSYPRAGRLADDGEWSAPVAATLFFAGEATAGARGGGLVPAALESGRRAAAEVCAEMAVT
jgi:monoamine oxidase